MFDITEALKVSFDYQIRSVYTALPCIIVNIKSLSEMRVDVQPQVNIIRPDGTDVPHPPILSVPLMFPVSSMGGLTFPVQNGDTVLCVFNSKCIDMFKAGNGDPARPLDLRIFDKRDAVAIVGLFPFSESPNHPKERTWSHDTKDTVLVHNIGSGNEAEIRIKKDGRIIVNSNKEVEVNASSVTVNATNITLNGNLMVNGTVTATGDVVGAGKSLSTHTHNQTGHEAGQQTEPPT